MEQLEVDIPRFDGHAEVELAPTEPILATAYFSLIEKQRHLVGAVKKAHDDLIGLARRDQ
jgi:hypothetical protein